MHFGLKVSRASGSINLPDRLECVLRNKTRRVDDAMKVAKPLIRPHQHVLHLIVTGDIGAQD